MKVYAISGLGADKRVFTHLELACSIIPIEWIRPLDNEDFVSYCTRLSDQIDSSSEFGLMGVSFGGLVAIELSRILKPNFTILISSVTNPSELPKWKMLGKIGLLNLVPNSLIKPPQFISNFLFGATNRRLLKDIIDDTDPQFVRWSLQALIDWKSDFIPANLYRIHGTKDRIIPLIGQADLIKGGAHFMIVDQADLISEKINKILNE